MDDLGFTIEMPGAASPLTTRELCQTLAAAISHNKVRRSAAGEQLTSWEGTSGYLSSLQSVSLDKSLPLEIRFQAVIQFKNNVDKYWRLFPHVRNAVQPEEKAQIRSRLFEGAMQEEEKTLLLHASLVTAKIVRIDFTAGTWPEALGQLVGLLRTCPQAGNRRWLRGVLHVMLRVIKELASVRIKKDQTSLQSMAPEICYLLAEVYSQSADAWSVFLTGAGNGNGGGDEDEVQQTMANSLVALKAVHRLIMVGFDQPHHDKTVLQIWSLVQTHFSRLLALVGDDSSSPIPAPYRDQVEKHLLQYTKFHLDMAHQHPASLTYLPDFFQLVRAYWDLVVKFSHVYDKSGGIRMTASPGGSDSKLKAEGALLERLALKGLLLLRACVKIAFQPVQTFKYRTADTRAEQHQAMEIMRRELFKDETVIEITNIIISRLFVFRRADLDAWEESPEEWEGQEQSESGAYEWEVRPCAQRLFLDLLTQFKDLITPPLLEYFKLVTGPQVDVATKEAVYTAMGLAASHINNVFDFGAVLTSTIISDAQAQSPLHKVLRRRIAITVSEWVAVGVSDDTRPLVYELYRHLMNPADEINDEVVRITAARQLKWVVDELDFSAEAFLPFAGDLLAWMLDLVKTVDIDDTKLAILEPVRLIVVRLEKLAAQFGDLVMTTLPEIWRESGEEEFMVKQAVIAVFNALAASLGDGAQRYLSLMIPLLSEAANPDTSLHEHLIDESLELWNTLLTHSSPPMFPELIDLVPLVLPILEFATSTAALALETVESYILLAPEAMLTDRLRPPALKALAEVITQSPSSTQVRLAVGPLECLIRSAVELGGTQGLSVTLRDMVVNGFLPKILERLHGAWEAHQTTGPNRKPSDLQPTTEGSFFSILARIALCDPALFVEALSSIGAGGFDSVWRWLSEEWFSYASSCDSIDQQKLFLLGLTRLLEVSSIQDATLSCLQDYFSMWNSTIMELQDGVADAQDSLVWADEPDDEAMLEYATARSIREGEITRRDPVHCVRSFDFVTERLNAVVGRMGEAHFQSEWAVNVDADVLEQFRAITSGQRA